MDYWDEEIKDDVYMIMENGWIAKTYRIIEKNKNGKEKDKGWTCDILPKEIVVNEFFKEEKQEIDRLEQRKEDIEREMEEIKEEYSGEDGILEDVKNEKGNITKKNLNMTIKKLKSNAEEFEEELKILKKYLVLLDEHAKIKKQTTNKVKDLDNKLLQKYYELIEKDVKYLVVEKKWIERLKEMFTDELDNTIMNLMTCIKELAERYKYSLPEIERKVTDYEIKVKEHLKIMGFEI